MYYSDMSGHPGSNSSFLVEEVYTEDSEIDIFELFSFVDLEVLSEKILEQVED